MSGYIQRIACKAYQCPAYLTQGIRFHESPGCTLVLESPIANPRAHTSRIPGNLGFPGTSWLGNEAEPDSPDGTFTVGVGARESKLG